MTARRVLWVLIALAAWSVGWRAFEVTHGETPVSDLSPGDFADLPLWLAGFCAHILVVHGSCYGCERLVKGRERAWWITRDPHPRDSVFPHPVPSRAVYHALRVHAIPAEFIIRPDGEVAYVGNPWFRTPTVGCGP